MAMVPPTMGNCRWRASFNGGIQNLNHEKQACCHSGVFFGNAVLVWEFPVHCFGSAHLGDWPEPELVSHRQGNFLNFFRLRTDKTCQFCESLF
jgi:hypothetical protein